MLRGRLWVIATPIGNLEDLSPRAQRILSSLHLLACESTQASQRLFRSLGTPCPQLILYREDSSEATTQKILDSIEQGQEVGLSSDAGSPGLSDPGWRLVAACHRASFPVFSVPGPSALTAALAGAGQPTRRWSFEGFPPHKGGDRRTFFQDISQRTSPTVFFEAPHRLLDALNCLSEFCEPERELSISREISKIHETNLKANLAHWLAHPPLARGEIVLTLGQAPPKPASENNLAKEVQFLLDHGLSPGAIRNYLSEFREQTRNQAYQLTLQNKKLQKP